MIVILRKSGGNHARAIIAVLRAVKAIVLIPTAQDVGNLFGNQNGLTSQIGTADAEDSVSGPQSSGIFQKHFSVERAAQRGEGLPMSPEAEKLFQPVWFCDDNVIVQLHVNRGIHQLPTDVGGAGHPHICG